MVSLREMAIQANQDFKAGKQDHLYPEVDNRPLILPEDKLNLIAEKYNSDDYRWLDMGIISISAGMIDNPNELIVLVEEGIPDEFKSIIISMFEEVKPRILEMPSPVTY